MQCDENSYCKCLKFQSDVEFLAADFWIAIHPFCCEQPAALKYLTNFHLNPGRWCSKILFTVTEEINTKIISVLAKLENQYRIIQCEVLFPSTAFVTCSLALTLLKSLITTGVYCSCRLICSFNCFQRFKPSTILVSSPRGLLGIKQELREMERDFCWK